MSQGTWIDFWTRQETAGGRSLTVDAPLARMPLHVRAGSIVPVGPAVQHASEQPDAPLELRIYPGADALLSGIKSLTSIWLRNVAAALPKSWMRNLKYATNVVPASAHSCPE
jgi:alpha-glucosidase (family GH31 glycosyl hydrolase)